MEAEAEALDRAIGELAAELVERAAAARVTIATAESCTAGLVASSIASVPGASEVLVGGAVTYCDRVKHELLGVSQETLARHTAVSEQAAREMAEGACRVLGAELAVSLTGYAGPGGGTPSDPAGTVYIATCASGRTCCRRRAFSGPRNIVRSKAALRALESLLSCLDSL